MYWAYLLFFVSGCASLIYEVVWTRQFALLLGSTTYAITTVVVAFMSGLALGSYLAGKRGNRLSSPGRAYALLELSIAGYALLVPILMGAAGPLYRAAYPHVMDSPGLLTALRFAVSVLVLIVPTTAMGATLPLLMIYVNRGDGRLGRSAAWLYGLNTCGATVGTALAGFILLPALGLSRTTWVAAAMNLLVGTLGWVVLRRDPVRSDTRPSKTALASRKKPSAMNAPAAVPVAQAMVLTVAGVSGFTAMIYQIAWTRALVMSIGSSTYAFSCILAAFILGLGLGSLLVARWVDRLRHPLTVLGWMEFGIGIAAAAIVPVHGQIPRIVEALVRNYSGSINTIIGLEFLVVVAVTVVPTLLMGAAFPLMTRLVGQGGVDAGRAVGRVYVVNTLGTIIGCVLAGFVLIRGEVLGIRGSIAAAALVNAAVGTWLLVRDRFGPARLWALGVGALGAAAILLLALVLGRWNLLRFSTAPFYQQPTKDLSDFTLEFFREGVDTTVAVIQNHEAIETYSLTVNGKPDASTTPQDRRSQLLLGHLPALLNVGGKRACVVGLGCGMTAAAVAKYPYERIDCAELSDAVIEAAKLFAPYTDNILAQTPRFRLIRGDGRNHLLLTHETYDLIVSEPSNPWIAGVSSLFTREYFEICRNRLSPNGLLAIWMHSYSMSYSDFRMITHTLQDAFGYVSLWDLGNNDYCLVASRKAFNVPADGILRRYESDGVRADLYRAGIHDLAGVLGIFVVGGPELQHWVDGERVHTDDNAYLEFSAPRNLYLREIVPIVRGLERVQGSPFDGVVQLMKGDVGSERLSARVAACMDGRQALLDSVRICQAEGYQAAFERLIGACWSDPANVALCHALRSLCTAASEAPSAEVRAGVEGWREQMRQLPAPLVIHPRGGTAAELAAWLQGYALNYPAGSRAAIFYLRAAYELVPEDGNTVALFSLGLHDAKQDDQAEAVLGTFRQRHPDDGYGAYASAVLLTARGRYDEAMTALERTIESGAFDPTRLRATPALAALHDHPRFEELLGVVSSAPATQTH